MGRDRIAMVELAIVRRQCPVILELNASVLHSSHLHQFTIRRAKVGIPAIACEQAAGHREPLRLISLLIDRKRSETALE